MAKALGIGVPMYSRIERGERAVRKEQIQTLAKALEADSDELLKLWLADHVSAVMDGEEDIFNDVVTIAKKDIGKMNKSKNKYKGIDLFCGIGGFRLAMKISLILIFSQLDFPASHLVMMAKKKDLRTLQEEHSFLISVEYYNVTSLKWYSWKMLRD